MNDTHQAMTYVSHAFFKSLSGGLTDAELTKLEDILINNVTARRHYYDLAYVSTALKNSEGILGFEELLNFDTNFWKEMAEYEKTAPEIIISEEKPHREIRKVVPVPQEKFKMTKFHKFSLAACAAMILFLVSLNFIPQKPYSQEVATLVDQMNVKWADSAVNFKNGERLGTNLEPVSLDKGIVKIQYDDGVNVVVEGPAKFAVERSGIYVEYGRVFSQVSKTALGFSVNTPTSQFVDLGTEFGIRADIDGSTEVHVIKGKIQLFTGQKGKDKVSQIITEKEAVRYDANTGKTEAVPVSTEAFVQSINSRTNTVWRGQTQFNLASVVASRDGFHEPDSLICLNPTSGLLPTKIVYKDRTSNNTYNPVVDSDFIDGVFVPDGGVGPVQITSSGLTFDCPDTTGIYTHEIAAYKGNIASWNTTIPPAVFNKVEYNNDSIVVLHSNVGITFDLQAIRQSLPELNLKSFNSRGGLTEQLRSFDGNQTRIDVDLWILIDGQVKYEKQNIRIDDGLIPFNIELGPQDRFLTLIVTEGFRTAENMKWYPYSNDFFYLIDPQLSLIERPSRP